MLQHALTWAGHGFRIFPLKPGEKTPVVKDWPHWATTDPALIEQVWRDHDYNIGVLCAGMTVVDVDVKNGKPGKQSFKALDLPDTLTVKTPSGGIHCYYASPDTANSAGKLGDGIDTRGIGGYVIAPGSVLKGAEKPYELLRDLPLAELPERVLTLLEKPRRRSSNGSAANLDTPAAIEEALTYLEDCPRAVEGASGDHQTFVVAAMLHDFGVSEEKALELMADHWNDECSPPWSADDLATKVNNAYHYASSPAGIRTPGKAFSVIEEPRREQPWYLDFTDYGDDVDLADTWLVYNRIPHHGVMMIVAPSGAGKTFFLLKLAECLASGDPFFGSKIKDRCATLILSGEGGVGFKRRMKAGARGLPIMSLSCPALDTAERVHEMLHGIEAAISRAELVFEMRLGLVVIDTMASVSLASDENANSEMAKVITKLRELSEKYGLLFAFTHHTTKDGEKERGASAIFAGVDATIFIHYESKNQIRGVEITKNRDGWAGNWGSFTLEVVELGVDRDGDMITTCTLSMGEKLQRTVSRPPKHTEEFLRSFDAARVAHGLAKGASVEKDFLREAFGKQIDVSSSAATKAFERCLSWAQAANEITVEFSDGGVFLNDERPAIEEDDDD